LSSAYSGGMTETKAKIAVVKVGQIRIVMEGVFRLHP